MEATVLLDVERMRASSYISMYSCLAESKLELLNTCERELSTVYDPVFEICHVVSVSFEIEM